MSNLMKTAEAQNQISMAIIRFAAEYGPAQALEAVRAAFGAIAIEQEDREGDAEFATPYLSDLRWVAGELDKVAHAAAHLTKNEEA